MAGIRDHQNAFNAGELSPTLLGRGDIAAYHSGLKTCENWLLLKPGGLERRPGTLHVADAFRSDVKPKLIRFHVSRDASFAFELSEGFFRVLTQNGIVILQTAELDAISGVDVGTDELLVANHGYFDGAGPMRAVVVGGGVLPTGLAAATDYYIDLPAIAVITAADTTTERLTATNNYTSGMGPFRLKTNGSLPAPLSQEQDVYVLAPTSTSFQLSLTAGGAAINLTTAGSGEHTLIPEPSLTLSRFRLRGNPAPGTAVIPITASGTGFFQLVPQGQIPARFAHPYTAAQIQEVDYAQSGDVLYLAHQQVPPQKITRFSNAQWLCEEVDFYDGPYFLDQETFPGSFYPSVTVTPAALTGTRITFTASLAIFRGTDIGRMIRHAASGTPLRWGFGKIVGVSPITFVDADFQSFVATPFEWNAGADQIDNGAAHNIDDGEPIKFTATDGGVTAGQLYYAHRINANSLSVHLTHADALADTNRVNLAAAAGNNTVIGGHMTKTAHGIVGRIGPVLLSTTGTLPTGLSASTPYWIDAFDANQLVIGDSPGARNVVPSALNGTGTHQINGSTVPSTTCLVDIVEPLVGGGASNEWRLGAWAADLTIAFPRAVCFHEQRLIFAGTIAEPQTLYFSQSGDFENMAPDDEQSSGDHNVTAASALVLTIGSDVASRTLWMSPLRVLVVGCLDGPWVLQAPVSEAVSALDLPVTRRQAEVGIGPTKPVASSVALVFASHSPGFAFSGAFNIDQDSIVPQDLMVLSSQLAEFGELTQFAKSGPPLDTVWAVRADGQLLGLVIDPIQEITAWTRFVFGPTAAGAAVCESAATISDAPDGDRLWVAMRRTVNGVTKRTIEFMAPRFRLRAAPEDAHFVDAGVDQLFGSPTSVISGLSHLEGESVRALVDGATQGPFTVSGGSITLTTSGLRVHVGLAYASVAETLPLELRPGISAVGIGSVIKRVVWAALRVLRCGALSIGATTSSLLPYDFRQLFGSQMETPVPLRTGVVEVSPDAGWDRDGSFAFGTSEPLACQILALMERAEWGDR